MERLPKTLMLFLLAMAAFTPTSCRQPVLHRVGGGRYTWRPNMNYTEWANHEKFYIGDWLYFGFDKRVHNVLQVNKTGYERCIEEDFIQNITRGGRDVFNLTQAKPYYFICGRGYCFQGMKVAVHAVEDIPTIPTPLINASSGLTTCSTPNSSQLGMLLLMLAHSLLLLCLL